jgi:hypothetical protein
MRRASPFALEVDDLEVPRSRAVVTRFEVGVVLVVFIALIGSPAQ